MIPGSFSYHCPSSVQEAVGLLTKLGDDGRALAGGHSLIPMMKLRLAEPAHLVDLAGIAHGSLSRWCRQRQSGISLISVQLFG